MDTLHSMNKPRKTSLVKNAAWSIASEIFIIIIYLYLLFKPRFVFIPSNPMANSLAHIIAGLALIIFEILFVCLSFSQTRNVENQDELSKFHKYKAGYISRNVCLIAIFIAILLIKDYSFMQGGDIFAKISPAVIIFAFARLVENITFIILEKCNLE